MPHETDTPRTDFAKLDYLAIYDLKRKKRWVSDKGLFLERWIDLAESGSTTRRLTVQCAD